MSDDTKPLERAPKVRTSHHRNKEEAARLQALVDKRLKADGMSDDDWQPIKTAPKIHHRRILVCRLGAKRYPVVGEDYWSDTLEGGCWAKSPRNEQPTHWMPLPEPPVRET